MKSWRLKLFGTLFFGLSVMIALIAVLCYCSFLREKETGCGPGETFVRIGNFNKKYLGNIINVRPAKIKDCFCVAHDNQ